MRGALQCLSVFLDLPSLPATSPGRTSTFERHARLGQAVLFAAGLLAALMLLEAFLRVRDPFGQRLRGTRILLPTNVRYALHNEGDPRLEPEIVLSRNSLGFRGPEPPVDFDHALTVVAIGGSTTECRSLTDGKDWPAVLARRMAPAFRELWVNNAGLDGHSSFGHAKLLEQRVMRLRPKVALFLVGINDVGRDDLKYQDRALTERRDDLFTVQGLLLRASQRSLVVATALNLWRGERAQRMRLSHRFVRLELLPRARPGRIRSDAVLAEHRADYLPGYRQRVRRLVQLCREAAIEPVLVTQPALYGSAVDDATGVDLRFVEVDPEDGTNGNLAWRVLELYNDVLREEAPRLGAAVVDLGRALPKSSRLFYDFHHLTNEGAAAAGAIVAAELCPLLQQRFPEQRAGGCPGP
jgi:lysophospholipase L1-like esterase